MNIRIYLIEKKIEKYYSDAIREYIKRLSKYCKSELLILKKEEELLGKLRDNATRIKISQNRKQVSSEELAKYIEKLSISGISNIDLIIGYTEIAADKEIELSQMDMNNGLQAAILFEQIYRAYRIINGEPYHK